MILPDVNVLLYAYRVDSPQHGLFKSWLSGVVNGQSAYGISPQILSSVIGIATNPKIYLNPSRTEDVIGFADALLDQPNCRIIRPGPGHWTIFRNLCRETGVSGNLVPDAWLAALAIEHGCEWITSDLDFAKFPGLRWRNVFPQ